MLASLRGSNLHQRHFHLDESLSSEPQLRSGPEGLFLGQLSSREAYCVLRIAYCVLRTAYYHVRQDFTVDRMADLAVCQIVPHA